MVRKLPMLVMTITFTGFLLSFVYGDQWFKMVDCPDFFPGYETSFANLLVSTIYNCVYQAEKEPTVKSLVFHKDSQTGKKTCYLYAENASSCEGSVGGDSENTYLFKPNDNCGNGGSLTEDKLSCDCNDGYFGPFCTELASVIAHNLLKVVQTLGYCY
ncbi:hypothetical protein LOTGIDRAFT_152842 [Lottia gigantea]|uniref:EGF-like domain-containing protein n=1 Tax=Lottia gigantea TaxID=225164 RepID=V4C7R3_LOTGI|nr:hypothetical protein LOTGIDRAFT_152842 [Lottia gigantea]ESO97749.1 hypothetical protein LOTGIDRAFT_152842 [Lottia gigantea]